jgi:hypothetical protein
MQTYEIEWDTLRDGAEPDKDGSFDFDSDIECNVERVDGRLKAFEVARRKIKSSFFGCVRVRPVELDERGNWIPASDDWDEVS